MNIKNQDQMNKWLELLHDIKSPLTIIMTTAELLDNDNPKVKLSVSRIKNSAEKVNSILEQMDALIRHL
ncbi:MAG: hypothetical protein NTZ80_01240 [Patescibacteria group bacterium]|nr:hypothetical protein [Patescibacteria group bacterium]